MSITLKEVKQHSNIKWISIQDKFNEAFGEINTRCGFCNLALQRTIDLIETGSPTKCDNCIPKIKDICFEMQLFFSDKRKEIDTMITRIHLYIKNATIEDK